VLQNKVLKGEKPSTARPGSLLKDADLAAERADAEKRAGRHIDDQKLASFLMYPKVFTDFAATERKYGPVSVLPTPIYFYGMQAGDETSVAIEKGKSLVVRSSRQSEKPTRRAKSASFSSSMDNLAW
jgi:pyruvate carboxylase